MGKTRRRELHLLEPHNHIISLSKLVLDNKHEALNTSPIVLGQIVGHSSVCIVTSWRAASR